MLGGNFTLRAIIAGLLIGLLVNLTNTYYGLRVGAGGRMSMVSGLLGYVGFKLISRCTHRPLTPEENVLLISVSTAAGCMPLTAGFIGIIPALEYLIGPDENGPLARGFLDLVMWSLGVAFFCIVFAALLREQFVEKEELPWPGARETAKLVETLHHEPKMAEEVDEDETNGLHDIEPEALLVHGHEVDWGSAMSSLLRGAIASGIITIVLYFFPILHELPVFDSLASLTWLWNVDLSPDFFGQGIIIGPYISLHILTGAIIGWGILSPYAKYHGWAPGDVDDWETGSRGWIIWVSLASLLSDAFVKLVWLVVSPVWGDYVASGYLQQRFTAFWDNRIRRRVRRAGEIHYTPLLPADASPDNANAQSNTRDATEMRLSALLSSPGARGSSVTNVISPRLLRLGFLMSIAVCTVTVHFVFGDIIPWYHTLLAIALTLPMAAVGIRSIAETDYNPESAVVSQLIFATITLHTDPNAIAINLISERS
ncbi:hypothetical protein DL98DRAFT_596317 [Cadophora sp. DSE1049]|nr:hypothetical protein DL98DRAFT_596317 [Cadophora sp. DSE1049]